MIRDYSGLSFSEINELNIFIFWQLLRDAIIFKLKQTESGNELLEECYCFEQTKPDRDALLAKGMKVIE